MVRKMKIHSRPAVTLVALVMAIGCCAVASAKTVSYNNVVSPSKLISCYVVMHSSEIQCTAPYLPDIGELDSYYALRPHGKAILSERGDFPGYGTPRRTLHYGDLWKRTGTGCSMRTTGMTCRNRDGHGFHVQKGHSYRF
jgi:hypothetical protein